MRKSSLQNTPGRQGVEVDSVIHLVLVVSAENVDIDAVEFGIS